MSRLKGVGLIVMSSDVPSCLRIGRSGSPTAVRVAFAGEQAVAVQGVGGFCTTVDTDVGHGRRPSCCVYAPVQSNYHGQGLVSARPLSDSPTRCRLHHRSPTFSHSGTKNSRPPLPRGTIPEAGWVVDLKAEWDEGPAARSRSRPLRPLIVGSFSTNDRTSVAFRVKWRRSTPSPRTLLR